MSWRGWVATIDLDVVRTLVALVVLALLCTSVIVALVFVSKHLKDIAFNQRRIHQQQATIIGMMLKAGFRPLKHGADWFDDAHATRVRGDLESSDTDWDWRQPD